MSARLRRRLAFRRAAAELVRQRLAGGREVEADRIDAIALSGRRRPIRENMALVRSASRADDLRPDHAVAGIANRIEMALGERLGEARPAGSALELGAAMEQGQPAQPAGKHALAFLVEEQAAERRLRPMLEQDVLLFRARAPPLEPGTARASEA